MKNKTNPSDPAGLACADTSKSTTPEARESAIKPSRQNAIPVRKNVGDGRFEERALAGCETPFREICACCRDAILITDGDGCLSYWNRAAELMFGFSFDEAAGKVIHRLLAPRRYHRLYQKSFAQFRLDGKGPAAGRSRELVAQRKDGKEFPVELSLSAAELGGDWRAVVIVRDVSGRVELERALLDREQLFRTVVETVPDVLYRATLPENVVTYVSPSVGDLLGYSAEAFLNDKTLWLRLLHDDDRARVQAEIDAAIRDKATKIIQEYRMWHKNRRDLLWLQNRLTLIRGPRGVATAVVGSLHDITELKRIHADLEKVSRIRRTLSCCNSALVHASEESELPQTMCRIIVDVGGYNGAWVGYARHDKAKTLQVMAQAGFPAEALQSLKPTWMARGFGTSPSAKAIRTGKRQIVQHAQTIAGDDSTNDWCSALIRLGIGSLVAIPLRDGGKIRGNLTIYSAETHAFDRQEVELLQELADDLSFGIMTLKARDERRKALEERQRHLSKLRQTLEATIQAIAATVEMRDPYTAGHERRVAELATAIAREMALPEHCIDGIRVGATVHDLGKIQVPAELLSNPRRLSAIEFELIKTHPQMGYNILKDIDFPWPVAQMVLQHHERLDGSGYPNGLRGRKILLEARILAVADIVEAIASHRPYRPGLGVQTALDEIVAGRGKQYDADVVDACLRLFRDKNYALQE